MIKTLAYVRFASPGEAEWRTFGPEVLGAALAPDGPGGEVRLRVDEAPWRVEIRHGDADDLVCLGWEVDDVERTITSACEAGASRSAAEGDPPGFVDPFGFRHEVVASLGVAGPFEPGRPMSGFVTGEQGLGHVVLVVPDLPGAEAFYTRALGLRVSDQIDAGTTIRFFHCEGSAARHHTLAMVGVPGMVGLHHLMLEVRTLDDVGSALDVVAEREIPLAMGLGRHTNDLMTSFYVRTPSGFEIEYGTGGVTIDDSTWETAAYDAMSIWGHRPPAGGPLLPGILRPAATSGATA